MQFNISNVAKIKEASVDLGGLTVVAGENDTGKSTVGKLIFAIVKALGQYEQDLNSGREQKIKEKVTAIYLMAREHNYFEQPNIKKRLSLDLFLDDIKEASFPKVQDEIEERQLLLVNAARGNEAGADVIDKIETAFSELEDWVYGDVDVKSVVKSTLNQTLLSEFHLQLSPFGKNENSQLQISEGENEVFKMTINDNKIDVHFPIDITYFNDVTFVDTPAVLQMYEMIINATTIAEATTGGKLERIAKAGTPSVVLHQKDLIKKLSNAHLTDGLLYDDLVPWAIELETIHESIGGHFSFDSKTRDFIFTDKKKNKIKSLNTASGIKSFGIIQLLLQANLLDKRSLLVIDEPETHLHPQWQVAYAKLLVQLANAGISVLLTTHSPYLLQAVVHHSKTIKMEDTHFYLAENDEDGFAAISDVGDDLNRIFQKLAEPLQNLVWK